MLRRAPLLALALLTVPSPAAAENALDSLHRAVDKMSRVRTVQADIEQELEQLKVIREYEGAYRAADGQFRIEFSKPRGQTIVHDGDRLHWYIEAKQTVWESEPTEDDDERGTRPATLSYDPDSLVGITGDGFAYKAYRESHLFGLLGKRVRFVLTPKEERKDLSRLEVVIDAKTETVITVDLYDTTGALAVRQIFGKYHFGGDDGAWPGRVEVQVWTPAGPIRSATRYRNILLNDEIEPSAFVLDLPPDTKREPLAGAMP